MSTTSEPVTTSGRTGGPGRRTPRYSTSHPHYRWVALSNTTLGVGQGVSSRVAQQIGALPPVGLLFAAFLGINPIQSLLQQAGALDSLSPQAQATPTGRQFLPDLINGPLHSGLTVVMLIVGALTLLGAAASSFSGRSTATDDAGPGGRSPDPAPAVSGGLVPASARR